MDGDTSHDFVSGSSGSSRTTSAFKEGFWKHALLEHAWVKNSEPVTFIAALSLSSR